MDPMTIFDRSPNSGSRSTWYGGRHTVTTHRRDHTTNRTGITSRWSQDVTGDTWGGDKKQRSTGVYRIGTTVSVMKDTLLCLHSEDVYQSLTTPSVFRWKLSEKGDNFSTQVPLRGTHCDTNEPPSCSISLS